MSVNLAQLTIPEDGHPLRPLVVTYMQMRESARSADKQMERIAPTPMTLADEHPADSLVGNDLEVYTSQKYQRSHFEQAARMLYRALMLTADELGGLD